MPLEAYKEYFGEKQGLLMAFKAHITQGYGLMAVFGIVVMFWWAAIHAKSEGKYEITASGSIVIYAAVVALWSICNTEIWKRTERTYALEWGMVGYEEKEQRRPQFKGLPRHARPRVWEAGRLLPALQAAAADALRRRGDVPLHRRQSLFLFIMRLDEDRGRHGIIFRAEGSRV